MNGRNKIEQMLNMHRTGKPGSFFFDGRDENGKVVRNKYVAYHTQESTVWKVYCGKQHICTLTTISGVAATIAKREHIINESTHRH